MLDEVLVELVKGDGGIAEVDLLEEGAGAA
jgi:hypothetical protein